jgi:two-component system sensor histidine kinase LytS
MAATIFSSLLVLLLLICVIVVVACFLTRSKLFTSVPDNLHTVKTQVILIFVIGLLSIYGTVNGVEMSGAIVNARELGPGVASLIMGSVVGLAAGLTGFLYRGLEGVSAIPCSPVTIPALLFGGIIWLGFKKFCGGCLQSDDIWSYG